MLSNIFDLSPTVELLQVLARGSLRQNLAKGIRLWVILRSLYGDETDPVRLQLNETFTYSDWNKLFFTQTDKHHKGYTIPPNHDAECACAKTISDWLFQPNTGVNPQQWRQSFLKLYPMAQQDLDSLLSEKLFAVTSKNIQYDFKALIQMGWMRSHEIKPGKSKRLKIEYSKIEDFPNLAIYPETAESGEIRVRNAIQNDLADFFEDFGREINGEQRFFLDIEYIVHRQFSRQIETIRQQLKSIWQQFPIPPIKITYVSASNYQNYQDEGEKYIVYPVCIYYSHRAPYLFAFGQTPKDESKIDWYDYRLDRVQNLLELNWDKINLPGFSLNICSTKTPRKVEELRNEAWGFDFYKPQELLLIRFDRYFHYRYIEGTERDELFKKISYTAAKNLILKAAIELDKKQEILTCLSLRSPEDIYCRLNYRVSDNNTIMRLRAWGAAVEVLLPYKLRSRIAKDLQETYRLYHT